jgi:hypothetical protein
MSERCGRLKPAARVKTHCQKFPAAAAPPPAAKGGLKEEDGKKKKKKKKEVNAGLTIPASLTKAKPTAGLGFAKSGHFLQLMKSAQNAEKEDRLKLFLKP